MDRHAGCAEAIRVRYYLLKADLPDYPLLQITVSRTLEAYWRVFDNGSK